MEGGADKRKEDESVPISVSSWFLLLGLRRITQPFPSSAVRRLKSTDNIHALTPLPTTQYGGVTATFTVLLSQSNYGLWQS